MRLAVVKVRSIAVVFLAILLCAACLVLMIPQLGLVPAVSREQQYGSAAVNPPSTDTLLTIMQKLTDPSMIGSGGEPQVSGLFKAQPGDPVVQYLETLSNFSSNMRDLKSGIREASDSFSAGNFTHATENVNQLLALRNMTQVNLNGLNSTVTVLLHNPDWNATKLLNIDLKIGQLQRLLDEYSAQIDQMEGQISLRSPILRLTTPNSSLFINQTVWVYVTLLSHNLTALVDRNVTVSWGLSEVTLETDVNGTGRLTVHFPVGYPAGTATLSASFQPVGLDAETFVSAYATAPILVKYYPTEMRAAASPSECLPLDFVNVTGTLTTPLGVPLANRTLTFTFDNTLLGSGMTGNGGGFQYAFQVPALAENGNHSLLVFFTPRHEILATSNVTLPLRVTRQETATSISSSSSQLFSGTSVTVTGGISKSASTSSSLSGNLILTLDGLKYASIPIGEDGTFSSTIPIPFAATLGNHVVGVIYTPDDPRLDGSDASVQFYVFNTPIVIAVVLCSGLAPGVLVVAHRRRRARIVAEQEVSVEEPAASLNVGDLLRGREANWDMVLATVAAESMPSKLVSITFRLIQTMINNMMGQRTKLSETHREFYNRVTRLKPALGVVLKPLVELFEVAEYGPFALEAAKGDEAKRVLLSMREAKWV